MMFSIASLAAVAAAQTPGPVTLAHRESPGVQLVYRTIAATTVAPKAAEGAAPVRSTLSHTSTTFVRNGRFVQGAMESDVRTFTDGVIAGGAFSDPASRPKGTEQGGGLQRRDARGRWLVLPATTDFAPELPVPFFPARPVQPGSTWTDTVSLDGGRMPVQMSFSSWEERGGVLCARLEATGMRLKGMPQSGAATIWVDPATGRTIRLEALFRKTTDAGMISLSYTRFLLRAEGTPQPRPAASGGVLPSLSGPIGRGRGGVLPPVGD